MRQPGQAVDGETWRGAIRSHNEPKAVAMTHEFARKEAEEDAHDLRNRLNR